LPPDNDRKPITLVLERKMSAAISPASPRWTRFSEAPDIGRAYRCSVFPLHQLVFGGLLQGTASQGQSNS